MDELHGAAQRKNCKWLANDFQKRGREVNLKEVRRNESEGAELGYLCVFGGEDALHGAKLSQRQAARMWRKS